MLRKENAVRVLRPTWTSTPDVIGTEALRKVSAGYCTADIFDEPAHDAKSAIRATRRPASRGNRSVGGMTGREAKDS